MGLIKEININNQTYYFFGDTINIKNFHSYLLKIDKKSYKNIDVYYIGYITIKRFDDCENIHSYTVNIQLSVNPLYLMIHSATGHFKEKNDEKCLILDSTDKYEEVWSGGRSEIKTLNSGKEHVMKKNHERIGINTEDDLPLNKPTKFPTLTIIIRCVFQEGERLYPQIYLDKCLYKL